MPNIHVLIPSYNCGEWIERCLQSAFIQDTPATKVLVIDDASNEVGYAEKTLGLCLDRNFMYLRNDRNMKCPYNLWLGVKTLNPEPDDVIFLLDGDDFLPDEHVFTRMAEVYSDPDVWMTYGNYQPYPYDTGQTLASAYPPKVVRDRDFRKAGNRFNHPITFRRFLFDAIPEADLKNRSGEWFRGGYDFAIIVPMLEMATGAHYKFLDETLYMYNAVNPISDSKVNVDLINETHELIRRPKKGILRR